MLKWQNVKWWLFSITILIVWCWLSSFILFFLSTHHFKSVSPLLFIMTFIKLFGVKAAYHSLIVSGLASALIISVVLILFAIPSIPDIYGKARFANLNDIKKAGLFSNQGVLLGKRGSSLLRLNGYEHVTVFAPTGTGKTTGVTVPNLLDWQESSVVSDIKLQLFKLTSKYRESLGHQIYLWSLGNPDGMTHCYNPMDIIGDNPYTRIDEIQKIANIFIPDQSHGEQLWEPQARMMFLALTLYVLDTPALPKNIATVVQLFKLQKNFVGFINHVLATRNDLDPICIANFMKLAEMSEKTRSSVMFTFTSHFELFDNPLIVAATSRSDFDIRKLRQEKMTIYVGITNDNLVRLAPLLTIFYQQVADVMTRKVPDADEPYGVLLLMDEFSSLRRMESFQKNIGLFREYRLRCILIIQELSQLYDIYGREGAKVFINAKVRIAYTQNDEETCKLIESILGTKTILVRQRSKNITGGLLGNDTQSESTHYVARPLMLSQEIRWMPENKTLIMVQGYPAIYAKKIAYFKEKPFKERILGSLAIQSILPEVNKIIENIATLMNTQTQEINHLYLSEQSKESLDNFV